MIPPSLIRAIEAELAPILSKACENAYEYGKEEIRLYKYRQPRSIVILGPNKSGKTTLYKALGAIINSDDLSDKQNYEKFKFNTSRGEVNIKSGIDYPGDKKYIDGTEGPDLKSHILNNDRIIYLFDIDKLYDDNKYTDNVIRQLSALYFYGKSISKIGKIFIFGTYTQLKFCSDDDAEDYIQNVFHNTECENLKDSIFVTRLTLPVISVGLYEDIPQSTSDTPISFSFGYEEINMIKDKVFNE